MGINYRLSGTTNCFESVNGIFSDLLLTDKKSFCTQSDVYGQLSSLHFSPFSIVIGKHYLHYLPKSDLKKTTMFQHIKKNMKPCFATIHDFFTLDVLPQPKTREDGLL